jgi:hypothetical protein
LDIGENRTHEMDVKIPGDISDRASAEGIGVPWEKITSYTNVASLFILSMGVLLTWLLWPKIISRSKAKRKDIQ